MSPRALVAGAPMWGDAQGAADPADSDRSAVVGTVTRVDTDRDRGAGGARTTVEVDADVLLGTVPPGSRGDTVIVSQSVPGWLNGHGFQVGTRYFIPLRHTGPDGRPNYSFVCDPIAQVSDVEGLVMAAREAGVVDVVVAGGKPVTPPRAEQVTDDDPQFGGRRPVRTTRTRVPAAAEAPRQPSAWASCRSRGRWVERYGCRAAA